MNEILFSWTKIKSKLNEIVLQKHKLSLLVVVWPNYKLQQSEVMIRSFIIILFIWQGTNQNQQTVLKFELTFSDLKY